METTRLSSKGQVILPSRIRSAHKWQPGLEFSVEDTPDGVLTTASEAIQADEDWSEVFGCAGYRGPAKTIEEMDAAIAAGIRASR